MRTGRARGPRLKGVLGGGWSRSSEAGLSGFIQSPPSRCTSLSSKAHCAFLMDPSLSTRDLGRPQISQPTSTRLGCPRREFFVEPTAFREARAAIWPAACAGTRGRARSDALHSLEQGLPFSGSCVCAHECGVLWPPSEQVLW